jgi:Tfp pilus assembly protein PilN
VGVDLKKEIKLSDLFKRRPKAEAKGAPKEEQPTKAARRGFSLSFRRGGGPSPDGGRTPPAALALLPVVPLMRAFNLMPGEESRERKGGRVAPAQVGVALLGVLVVAGLAGAYMLMSARATDKQGQLDDVRAQLAAQEVPSGTEPQTPAQPSIAGESQARTTALADALSARVAWDRILREFSLVLPKDVWLTNLTAGAQPGGSTPSPPPGGSASGSAFSLTGYARSHEAVALLLSRMEVIPEFSSVLLESSKKADGPNKYEFTIVATVGQGGAAS